MICFITQRLYKQANWDTIFWSSFIRQTWFICELINYVTDILFIKAPWSGSKRPRLKRLKDLWKQETRSRKLSSAKFQYNRAIPKCKSCGEIKNHHYINRNYQYRLFIEIIWLAVVWQCNTFKTVNTCVWYFLSKPLKSRQKDQLRFFKASFE